MPRFIWKHPNERYTCFSKDADNFYGAYWKKLDGGWYAHISPIGIDWYIREFPDGTKKKEVEKECENLINHFSKEKDKWKID